MPFGSFDKRKAENEICGACVWAGPINASQAVLKGNLKCFDITFGCWQLFVLDYRTAAL